MFVQRIAPPGLLFKLAICFKEYRWPLNTGSSRVQG
jgi:hypothetical protein